MTPIDVVSEKKLYRAQLIDLTEQGAQIEGVPVLSVGSRVYLRVSHQEVEAVVRWVADGRVGVAFRPILLPWMLNQLLTERPTENGWTGSRSLRR